MRAPDLVLVLPPLWVATERRTWLEQGTLSSHRECEMAGAVGMSLC
jgi:hypothetical protein